LRLTFFGHFCAGEDQEGIRPTVKALDGAGVGSILDYAAEANSLSLSPDFCETYAGVVAKYLF